MADNGPWLMDCRAAHHSQGNHERRAYIVIQHQDNDRLYHAPFRNTFVFIFLPVLRRDRPYECCTNIRPRVFFFH